jgi:hypothetical protein
MGFTVPRHCATLSGLPVWQDTVSQGALRDPGLRYATASRLLEFVTVCQGALRDPGLRG